MNVRFSATVLLVLAVFALCVYSEEYSLFSYTVEGNCSGMPMKITVKNQMTGEPVRAQVRYQIRGAAGILEELAFNWTSQDDGVVYYTPPREGTYYISITRPGYDGVDFEWNISYCPECRTNADCNTTSQCVNNTCMVVDGTCGHAVNHAWVNYQCCANEECTGNQVCTEGVCTDLTGRCGRAVDHTWYNYECCFNSDCLPGNVCMDHACTSEAQCLSDTDCMDNERCMSAACVIVTGDCGIASNHRWIQYECCSDDACGAGQTCLDNHTCGLLTTPTPSTPPNRSPCAPGFLLAFAGLLAFAFKR